LRRVRNVRANPRAALLIDYYVEDWRRLWWVLLRGRGRVLESGLEHARAIMALKRKYPQYRSSVPLAADALVIAIDVQRLSRWRPSSHGPRRVGRPGRSA